MRPSSVPPRRLLFCDTSVPEDFGARLDAFKEATDLTWEGLAACLGVDPRQLQRWRDGTKPSGDGFCALVLLAAHIPGGLHILLGVHVLPPPGWVLQPPLAGGSGSFTNGGGG